MINIRALSQKPANGNAIPPTKNSIPARIFIYRGGFSPANLNSVENYVYSTQDKLLGVGYAVVDRSATGNATMFELTSNGNASPYHFAVLIDNGSPVLLFIDKFTEYEQFMLRYGLLTPFIDRYLPALPEQTVPMHHIIEPPAQPKYW